MINKKKYFSLNREAILVRGKNKSAIYNLYTGKIFSCDPLVSTFLKQCDNNSLSIEENLNTYDEIKKIEILDELENLEKLELGCFYNKRTIIEKIKSPFSKYKNRAIYISPILSELTIELTNECNLNCNFCGGHNQKLIRCGCWRHEQKHNVEKLSLNDWLNIVDEALLFNCKSIKITGGEPYIELDKITHLLNLLKNKRIKSVVIWTNGALLTQEIINQLNGFVKLEIPFFSLDEKIHEKITGDRNSFYKIINTLKHINNSNVTFKINLIDTELNNGQIKGTYEFLRNLGIKNCNISYKNINRFNKNNMEEFPFLSETSVAKFHRNKEGHPCWDGKLAVTYNGNILPCIMARNFKIANIHEKSLHKVLIEKNHYIYWDLSKDKIEGCKECEYRYACFDCRLLHTTNESLNERNIYCNYQK